MAKNLWIVPELNKRNIPVKLSFNQLRCILYHLQFHQSISQEGKLIRILMDALEKHLLKEVKNGKISEELLDQLNISLAKEKEELKNEKNRSQS